MTAQRETASGESLRQLLRDGQVLLEDAGIADARTDAWLLLEAACGTDRQTYLMNEDVCPDQEKAALYRSWLDRRLKREPVQYILGEAWFCGLRFAVTPDVLIPRLDTEVLAEEAAGRLFPGAHILDLCTGSGCILLSLMSRMKASGSGADVSGCGSDISGAALQVAAANARRLGLLPTWVVSDLFENIDDTYDMIVSNPPYIARQAVDMLDPEVKDHEPHLALDGGQDGLDLIRAIIREAPPHLKEGGYLLLEIGYDQGEPVHSLLQEAGYGETAIIRDLAGLDRVAAGRKIHV